MKSIGTVFLCWHSLASALDIPEPISFDIHGTTNHLPLEKVTRIISTEVSGLLSASADSSDSMQTWKSLIDAENIRILQSGSAPSGLRRSTLMLANSKTPFLICDAGDASGEIRKQKVSKYLNASMPSLWNLYNKDDMSCFAILSSLSQIQGLPPDFEAVPILPEMKIPQGLLGIISSSEVVFGRVEAIMCPGVEDVHSLLVEIEERIRGISSLWGDRSLRVENFVASRTEEVDTQLHRNWHRALRKSGTISCETMLSQGSFDSFGDTVMYELSSAVYGDDIRLCISELLLDLALHDSICFASAYQEFKPLNDVASGVLQSGSSDFKPFYDVGLDGKRQVVALSDSGVDVDNCYFYDSNEETPKTAVGQLQGPSNPLARKVVQYVSFADDGDGTSGHGTHVAGSIAGRRSDDGIDEMKGKGDGVARAAKLAVFDIGRSNGGLTVPLLSKVFAAGYDGAGARIHSASWGNPNQNSYSSFEHTVDSYAYDHPDFLFVVAAGNSGRDRPSSSIASPGLNKNGITVGATQNGRPHIRNDMLGPAYLAEFSSRGPTRDGRRKPDVVAPGVSIESARADPKQGECDSTDGLTFKAGTSMATPLVSGIAAIVRQYFEDGWHESGQPNPEVGFSPRASLVKAVILNGSVELRGVQDDNTRQTIQSFAYDMNQGFGRVNLLRSLPLATKNNLKGIFIDSQTIESDQIISTVVTIDKEECQEPMSVSLVWTDPPVGPMCEESCVLNDLDLSVRMEGTNRVFYPNGLTGPDSKNNAERIRIEEPFQGSKYIIQVKGRQLVEAQIYSLVVTGCLFISSGDPPMVAPSPSPTKRLVMSNAPTPSPTETLTLEICNDTSGKFSVGEIDQTCVWLASESSSSIKFWCHWIDIALACPKTCNQCEANFSFGAQQATVPALDGTVRYFGNVFEIRPKVDMTLLGFDAHLFGSNIVAMEVWVRKVSAEWVEPMCRSSVVSRGRYQTVALPEIDCTPVDLTKGSVFELYVTTVSSKDLIMTPNPNWSLETKEFTLSNGSAVTYFDGRRAAGYAFDGGIRYRNSCKDNATSVRISDWVGEKHCSWISQNMDRMGFTCDFASVVLHCPETCGYCETPTTG